MIGSLDSIWEMNREFLHRFLISQCRDIDLADDLLQETYVLASRGFAGFRGDNARAWLTTIANNNLVNYVTRKREDSEPLCEEGHRSPDAAVPGSDVHLNVLSVREAVADLSPM